MEANIIEQMNFSLIVTSAFKFLQPLCKVAAM
jgi:hypothetical protein